MGKILVVVEDVDAARMALQWALQNLLRYGDSIILLHVFPPSRSKSKKKQRVLRLRGFQLALSFKDICNTVLDAKVEIVVREGDLEGRTIVSTVREIGASALVVGLHDQSFLYKMGMAHRNITSNLLNCRILAIKQPLTSSTTTTRPPTPLISTGLEFSQIEIARLCTSVPTQAPPQKIPYQILPSPFHIIWRRSRKRRKECS
ncbi:PREDICTED: uncharacterized protein LOC104603066 isoform X1 [Nelumbo nucifera]|uniref:Uncharacterized protein LOC104603066 isoform X1 n=1 Tax=Nelumbo nucifera TaxID=4432 RepID=A0A1U8ARD7_NELNU|nr:PREDICTED: uncharacterized protein LOC104603066 isoform X1 [Nelumbo nucifera]